MDTNNNSSLRNKVGNIYCKQINSQAHWTELLSVLLELVGTISRLTELEEQLWTDVEPNVLFVYSLRSPYAKEIYFGRLGGLFDAIGIKWYTFDIRCNLFVMKRRKDRTRAFEICI